MKLENDEKRIEIIIDSYEFPYHETNDDHDNNWLNVKAVYEDEVLVDECIEACLLTWELPKLRDGLSHALVGKAYTSSFMEEILKIEVTPAQEQSRMRICFAPAYRSSFEVEGIISKHELDAMVSDVGTMIKAFPIREKKRLN